MAGVIAEKQVSCPACNKKGKRVGPVTLRALLKPEYADGISAQEGVCAAANGNGEPGCRVANEDTGWRFCDAPACDIVYFSEEGARQFTRSQLGVAVGVKETTGERPLCYCFGHSLASIKDELRTKGRSDASEDIRKKMNTPGCRCEVTNPSGSCCLGSVAKGIKTAQEELNMPSFMGSPGEGGTDRPKGTGASLATARAVFTAILGSACCWLPLLLIAFGFSAAGLGSFFEQFRVHLLCVTFILLGLAWYLTYRRPLIRLWSRVAGKPVPIAADEACCSVDEPPNAAEACCPTNPSARKRLSIRGLNQVMLWIATAVAVGFALFPQWSGLIFGRGPASVQSAAVSDSSIVLELEGMTCEGCAATIRQALLGLPDVTQAEVDYARSTVVVTPKKGAELQPERLIQAVQDAGYAARLSKGVNPAGGGPDHD